MTNEEFNQKVEEIKQGQANLEKCSEVMEEIHQTVQFMDHIQSNKGGNA